MKGKILVSHLYNVIDHIRNQIKKRRVEKRLTQSDVAIDLGITPGAYSKIESGPTEITVKKLVEIAEILEVNVSYFFDEETFPNKPEDPKVPYGFASKSEVEVLVTIINKMRKDLAALKATVEEMPAQKKKK